MTVQEFQAAISSGSVKSAAPATAASPASGPSTTAAASPAAPSSVEQFLPQLVLAQSTQSFLAAPPTFVPQTFQDQIQFVFDGTSYFVYFYFNNQWNKFTSASALNKAEGTDTATFTSHSATSTHTITHGLGKPPSIILVNATLVPNGVPGSGTNKGNGVGGIMLDGSGNPIGGTCISILTGQPVGTLSSVVSVAAASNVITAETTTSGGTANMSVTVNNVTDTTFDIVYAVSDNGGAGAPTQSFSVGWAVMG